MGLACGLAVACGMLQCEEIESQKGWNLLNPQNSVWEQNLGSNLGSPACSFLGLQRAHATLGSGDSPGEWLLLEKPPFFPEASSAFPECVNPHLWSVFLTAHWMCSLLLGNLDWICKRRGRERKGGKLHSGSLRNNLNLPKSASSPSLLWVAAVLGTVMCKRDTLRWNTKAILISY